MPAGGDRGVAVQHLDVLERDAELVGDELAPRRLVPLAVRGRAGDDLDLAGGQHPDRGLLPAAGAVGERAEHPGGRQAAHLGEGGEADAQLHRVVRLPPALLLGAQLVVAEQLAAPAAWPARSRRCRSSSPAAVVNGNSSALIQFFRRSSSGSMSELDGELVHDPLDRERGLGPAGAAVGVGGHLVGEDALALEPVGRELVDADVHERAEDRHTRGDQPQVGAHVGEDAAAQALDVALAVGGDVDVLDLVAAVVGAHQRLAAGLGPLDRLAQPAGDQQGEDLLGDDLQLAAEAAADVGGDDPQLVLRRCR